MEKQAQGDLVVVQSGARTKQNARVARALNAAAESLERGWVQRHAETGRGSTRCVCVLQALWDATKCGDDLGAYQGAQRALSDTLNVSMGGGLMDWNDAKGRTQAEVVAAVRKAAASVSAQENVASK